MSEIDENENEGRELALDELGEVAGGAAPTPGTFHHQSHPFGNYPGAPRPGGQQS